MSKRFSNDKEKEKKTALQHIKELFLEAKNSFNERPDLSDEYVKKARAIQMKFKVRMPAEYKRKFCKSCSRYLVPNKNCRVRINGGKVIYCCHSCKNYMRIPLTKKRTVEK